MSASGAWLACKASLPRRRRWLAVVLARELAQERLEILGLAEIAIHRRKAHIGDVVEGAQRLHHHFADDLGRDLALALAFQLAHDLRHRLLDPLLLDRALAQRDLHRAQKLVAVERHPPAVALDHGQLAQLHALERRETEIAGEADAPAADDG